MACECVCVSSDILYIPSAKAPNLTLYFILNVLSLRRRKRDFNKKPLSMANSKL